MEAGTGGRGNQMEDKKNEKNEAPVNNEQQPQQQVTAPQTTVVEKVITKE